MSEPVYTAIAIVRDAIATALGESSHWQRNEDATPSRPYLVYDSQDGGGKLNQYVGSKGWRGLITVRAVADFQDEAEAALAPAYTAMLSLSAPSGYSIGAVYIRPITIPPTAEVRYAAAQWELFIERT